MSADALVKAVTALVTGVTFYDGTVPVTPSYPYVLGSSNFPRATDRAASRGVHARQVRLRTTVVGTSPTSVRVIAQKVQDALEGASVAVEGYTLSPVGAVPNEQPILEDLDVVVNGLHPQYVVLDWAMTSSRTA